MRYFPRYVKGKGFKQQKWPSPKWNCHGELFHCNSTWANNMLKLHGDPLCFKIIAWSIPCHRAPISVTLWECSIWPLAVVRPFIRQWSTAICRETIQSELSDCRVVYNATDRTQLTLGWGRVLPRGRHGSPGPISMCPGSSWAGVVYARLAVLVRGWSV